MRKELLHEVPSKLAAYWLPEHRAVLDEWANYHLPLADFREAVLVKGLTASKARGGRAWIVDSRNARGVFSDEIQQFIGSTIFPEFVKGGVRYFITIRSQVSAATNMTIQRYERQVGPAGIQLITVDTFEQALAFLADADGGRLAA
ncbi:MAG: hypothetical protein ACOZQL_43140 [Myxococcota bacterium]